jgi:GAF domain-containing protein
VADEDRGLVGKAHTKLKAMPHLLIQQLQNCSDLQPVLDRLLLRSLEMTGAALGNVQLMDWKTGYLTIAAQHGFNSDFLSFFYRVKAEDGSACGRALRQRSTISIDDVLLDQEFAPCRDIALEAGVRAVQSTPLISSSGAFVGVLSTHFSVPHRPSHREMHAIEEAGVLTANAIIQHRSRDLGTDGYSSKEAGDERIRKSREALARSYGLLRRLNGI